MQMDKVWSNSLKASAQLAKEEKPQRPEAATTAQIRAAVHHELTDLETQATIILCWATAGRPGCVAQLACDDLQLHPQDRRITVTFHRGKTVGTRGGPYSVHSSSIPQAEWDILCRWIQTRRALGAKSRFSSGRKSNGVLPALRRVSAQLEQRSMRRGSLQAMAIAGATNETLREFSGHTNDVTLLRYLNWGTIGLVKSKAMAEAGAALW